jgi:hypothetical protein
MGKVVKMDPGGATDNPEWGLRDVKHQIAHNMALDAELTPTQRTVAIALLFVLIDGETGWCYQKDEDLAQMVCISVATLRKAVKPSPAFLKYFDVVPGTRKGRATEYQLTQEALEEGAGRRSGRWKVRQRATGEMAVKASGSEPEARSAQVVNYTTRDNKGRNSCRDENQKIPPETGKNYPPIPGQKPKENPPCASEASAQTIDFVSFQDRFIEIYPRLGSAEATERELRQALEAGTDPEDILWGAGCYAKEQADNPPRYIAYSENWLKQERWKAHPRPKSGAAAKATVLEGRAKAIRECQRWVPAHFSDYAARELIALGLVTEAECVAAGLRP